MNSLIDLLKDRSDRYADREALVIKVGLRLERWTYRDVWQRSQAAAYYFREKCGLKSGDRVLIMALKCPKTFTCFLGGWLTGAVLIPLDHSSTPDFIARVIDQTEPAAVITHSSLPCDPAVRRIVLDEIPFGASVSEVNHRPARTDIAEIVFTSGTTSIPKGVVLTHENIMADVLALASITPEREDWRLLSLLPFSHMFEQTVGHFIPLEKGGTIYYPSSLSSTAIIEACHRHRIVSIVAVPALITNLLRAIEREVRRRGNWSSWESRHRLSNYLPFNARRHLFSGFHRRLGGSLRFLISGGARLDTAVGEAWQRMGVHVIEGYGVTECAPVISCDAFDSQIPGSVGHPLPGIHVRLSDEGEVQVHGINVMQGYWRNPDATRSAFTKDGWYRTGDLAAIDEAGRLHIKARLKEMIVLPNGLNVFPDDIEAVLARNEAVRECVVLGVTHGSGDTRLTALIVPSTPSADRLAAEREAIAAVRETNALLAPHQRINDVRLWPSRDFPRTALGKVKRFAVRTVVETEGATLTTAEGAIVDEDLNRLRHILGDLAQISPELINKDSQLDLDLGLSSLGRVELAVALGEEFGIAVEDSDLAELESVQQLMDLVHRGQLRDTPFPFPDWALSTFARSARELLQSLVLLPMHGLVARPFRILGRDNLADLTSPVLFVSNHCSHMDTVAIIRALPSHIRRRTAIAAAADYFYRFRFIGAGVSLILNTFPFSRGGAIRATFEHCGELVDDGWSVLVYPEGTRSTTGDILPFKSGAGYLAKELKVTIVPIAVRGGFEILPKGRAWPHPGAMTVFFGQPFKAPVTGDPDAIARHLRDVVANLKRSIDRVTPGGRREIQ